MNSETDCAPAAPLPRWLRAPWLWLLFCLAGLAAYAPSLNGAWIWDDTFLVGDNPFFKSPVFAFEVFRQRLFTESFSNYYRPIQNWSYMVDYLVWGRTNFGYHLTSVLVHATAAVLIQRLFTRLLAGLGLAARAPWLALAVAALWLVHPMHNAAVAYVSGRADSLAAMFAAGAWLLFLMGKETPVPLRRTLRWMAAGLCALLALCSKEIAIVWAALFVVHQLMLESAQPWRARLSAIAGLAAVFGVYLFLRTLPDPPEPQAGVEALPLSGRFVLMLRALGDYTRLVLWPAKLMMERTVGGPGLMGRPVSAEMFREITNLTWLGAIALPALLALAVVPGPTARARRWGVAWFLIGFLPISNLFPLNADSAEHWIYHSSLGLLVALVVAVSAAPQRWGKIAVIALLCALPALAVRTAFRARDWTDPERFFLKTMDSGGVTPRVTASLAELYAQRGDTAREEDILRRTVKFFPEFFPAKVQLANCLRRQGRTDEATKLLEVQQAKAAEAARGYPKAWVNALNLGQIKEGGAPDDALRIYREARTRAPHSWPLALSEAEAVEKMSGPASALGVVAGFAEAHWWHLEAQLAFGHYLLINRKADAAAEVFADAAWLDLRDPRALAGLAEVESLSGRHAAALAAQQRAVARDPNNANQQARLERLKLRAGMH